MPAWRAVNYAQMRPAPGTQLYILHESRLAPLFLCATIPACQHARASAACRLAARSAYTATSRRLHVSSVPYRRSAPSAIGHGAFAVDAVPIDIKPVGPSRSRRHRTVASWTLNQKASYLVGTQMGERLKPFRR
jgi:hypothetical protein